VLFYAYWGLLIVFGLLGVWHALRPTFDSHYTTRSGFAALVLYVLLILIGVREFLW
jgi:hypothetical protein